MRYTRQTTLTYGKIIYKAIFFVFSTQKSSNLEIRTRQTTLTYGQIIYKAIFFVFFTQKLSNLEIRTRQTTLTYMPYLYPAHPSSGAPRSCAESSIVLNDTFSSPRLLTLNTPSSFSSSSSSPSGRKRSTGGPVSYTRVAGSRSESTSQFTALALNKPSSSFSSCQL